MLYRAQGAKVLAKEILGIPEMLVEESQRLAEEARLKQELEASRGAELPAEVRGY